MKISSTIGEPVNNVKMTRIKTMSPLQPSTTSTVSGPTPPPWGDYSLNANIFNTSGTIITENVDNGTASFLLPEVSSFFLCIIYLYVYLDCLITFENAPIQKRKIREN